MQPHPLSPGVDPIASLTATEVEVCRKVATGLTNREIAADLYVTVKAVEFHVHNAFLKLGVHNRTQLAVVWLAMDSGSSD